MILDLRCGSEKTKMKHPSISAGPSGFSRRVKVDFGWDMEEASGWHNFLEILTKPDNIPIVAMLILVIFFTWLGLREALKNDKLIEEGKEDEIPNEMWK